MRGGKVGELEEAGGVVSLLPLRVFQKKGGMGRGLSEFSAGLRQFLLGLLGLLESRLPVRGPPSCRNGPVSVPGALSHWL